MAATYRRGGTAALRKQLGVDTNYVAAMQRAATHLPQDSVRPALILLTDGKHDVAGVPVSRVIPTRNQLFGSRSPFALLPVGMGLQASDRGALERGLKDLQIVKDMPACVSGATFSWPQTVFTDGRRRGQCGRGRAPGRHVHLHGRGHADAQAHADAHPGADPRPGAEHLARAGRCEHQDRLDRAPAGQAPGQRLPGTLPHGRWRLGRVGRGFEPRDDRDHHRPDQRGALECQVAAVATGTDPVFTAAASMAIPVGRPAPPAKPVGQALDHAARFPVPSDAATGISEYRYECSSDGGSTWTASGTAHASVATAEVDDLANGVTYVCRAFARNDSGISDPSPNSDAIRPCGSLLECQPILQTGLLIAGIVLGIGVLGAIFLLYRGRPQDYVVAVVDVIHTANLGHGSSFGIGLTRTPATGQTTGITRASGAKVDIQVRYRGKERFQVTDRNGRVQEATAGQSLVVVDPRGNSHSLVLWAFATPSAAAAEAGRH